VHPAIGQEATAVGVASVLTAADTVSAPHRGHHHALAKGMSPGLGWSWGIDASCGLLDRLHRVERHRRRIGGSGAR
jgi:TPP-dependent pyruvate/acetoin dehydrogenase alpha subunit